MLVETVYDVGTPDSMTTMELLLKLNYAIEIDMPWGETVVGVLREVSGLDSNRLVELTVEIDDKYEALIHSMVDARDIDVGYRIPDPCMEEC